MNIFVLLFWPFIRHIQAKINLSVKMICRLTKDLELSKQVIQFRV